jgi:hypothetical protein
MELGNMVFGNSRGEFSMERGEGYERELERLFYAIDPDYFRDTPFENDTFAVRSYYWGDCTCGFDAAEWEWCEKNKHHDSCYQTAYKAIPYDWLKQEKKHKAAVMALCAEKGIPYDAGRGSAVHCTCDYQRLWDEWISQNEHKDDCPIVLPNFHHKPSDYRLKWYKYPLRDSYANQELTVKQFRAVIDDCLKSLR